MILLGVGQPGESFRGAKFIARRPKIVEELLDVGEMVEFVKLGDCNGEGDPILEEKAALIFFLEDSRRWNLELSLIHI